MDSLREIRVVFISLGDGQHFFSNNAMIGSRGKKQWLCSGLSAYVSPTMTGFSIIV